jgi:hypothetical protein
MRLVEVKYLELNPSIGHYGYKSHNFNVIPEKIKALVPVCSEFFLNKTGSSWMKHFGYVIVY